MDKQTIIDRLNIKAYYTSELPSIKSNGSNMAQALCPWHNDTKPSLTINLSTGQFKCFGCDSKGSVFDFYMKRHSVDYKTAFNALAKEAGLTIEAQRKVVKTYDYVDESGKLLFQTVRYEPKDFKQRRPDGKGGWLYNLQGVELVPYNLPEVIKAKSIIVCEGEKDCLNLKAMGFTSTCNPMGAGKWRPEYNQYFKGKKVVIIPDADKPGRDHTLQVAKNLKGIAESVKVVELPELPEKGDATDWLYAGGTKEGLIELIKAAPKWEEPASQFHDTYNTHKAVKLKVSSLRDILSYEDPTYLINPILIENTLAILSSYAGVGKSLLSLFIAFSIISGKKLFDHFNVSKHGRVLIVDEENPGSFLKERLMMIGFTDDMPISFLHFQKVKLDRADCFAEITQIVKDLKPVLVIFDALIRIHTAKENDASEMALVMERLRDIVNLGTTVLVIHHHRKGAGDKKESVRGSSDIMGGIDMHLSLEEKGDYLILSSSKTRTRPIEPIRLKLETAGDTLSFRFMGNEVSENQLIINEILEILQGDLRLGVKEILEELKARDHEIGQNKLREVLQGATGKELIETTGDRGKKLYSLNSTFTASRVYIEKVNCEAENKPSTDLHSFTENPPLNCETDKCSYCILTPAQRKLCEVKKPCPVESQSPVKICAKREVIR